MTEDGGQPFACPMIRTIGAKPYSQTWQKRRAMRGVRYIDSRMLSNPPLRFWISLIDLVVA